MLTKISLEGFQSFGIRQSLELAPLTLLFGPNSSGKSSIGRLLRLLSQSAKGGGLVLNGEEIELGSLNNVAFRNEPHHGFLAELTLVPRTPGLFTSRGSSKWLFASSLRFVSGFAEIDKSIVEVISLVFTIFEKGNEQHSKGELTLTMTGADGAFKIAGLSAENLGWMFREHLGVSSEAELDDLHLKIAELPEFWKGYRHEDSLPPKVLVATSNEDGVESQVDLRGLLTELELSSQTGTIQTPRGGRFNGLVPTIVSSNFREMREGFLRFLAVVFDKARDEISAHMEAFQYIGPLREIAVGHVARSQEIVKMKSDGSNVQEHLASLEPEHFHSISEDLLGLSEGDFSLNQNEIPNDVFGVGGYVQTLVSDHAAETDVSFRDAGAGIAQVVPILAAIRSLSEVSPGVETVSRALREQRKKAYASTLFVEQPELHLHPKMQANLVDYLLKNSSSVGKGGIPTGDKPTVICETHSESILLRVQKRIREGAYQASKVAVYFVDQLPGSDTRYIDRLELAEDGRFTRNWPLSFSELRIRER